MKRLVQFANPWWLGGVALAASGVVLVRLAAPALGPPGRAVAELAGQLLALGGLAVIAIGVSRRVNRSTSA